MDMAVTVSFRPTVQPKWLAISPKTAVKAPIEQIETTKQAQPLCLSVKQSYVSQLNSSLENSTHQRRY